MRRRLGEGSAELEPPTADEPLDRERIVELLDRLDARLRERGASASLYVVGGAAVAMNTDRDRITRDIDVAELGDVAAEAAREVAAAEHLTPRWLNDSAAPWVPARRAGGPGPETGEPGLRVSYAPAEHLLAMKMIAMRTRDAADVVALAQARPADRGSIWGRAPLGVPRGG